MRIGDWSSDVCSSDLHFGDNMKVATSITLLSLLLGAAAMAAGAGEAGAGIMAAGQQAAMTQFLAYSRTPESSTDQAGAKYLSKAGISGKGTLPFFPRIQTTESRLATTPANKHER